MRSSTFFRLFAKLEQALFFAAIFLSFTILASCGRPAPERNYDKENEQARIREQKAKKEEQKRLAENAHRKTLEAAKPHETSGNYRGAIDEYNKFPNEYRDTEFWEDITVRVSKLQKYLKGEERYPKLMEEVGALVDKGAFMDALYLLNEYEIDYGLYQNRLNMEKAKIERMINSQPKNE